MKYFIQALAGVIMDIACQLWISIESIWKKKEPISDPPQMIELDMTEDFYTSKIMENGVCKYGSSIRPTNGISKIEGMDRQVRNP